MKTSVFIIGFFSLVHNESRRIIKGSLSSYFWFALLAFISIYSIVAENYADMNVSQSSMVLKFREAPMADIITFFLFFLSSSISDVLAGTIPDIVFPTSIGVAFFIIFPLMLGLTMLSEFITKIAAGSIAGEKEKKTLYILAISPQTKASIYLSKLIGIFFLTLPMIILLYIISHWVFANLFFSALNISSLVLKAASVTALLFASVGLMISVLWSQEKRALWAGTRIIASMTILTILWIFIPLIEFILNTLNSSTEFLPVLEKITHISPFTMDLLSVYDPAVSTIYLIIQMITSIIFLILGMVIFIRQDIEY